MLTVPESPCHPGAYISVRGSARNREGMLKMKDDSLLCQLIPPFNQLHSAESRKPLVHFLQPELFAGDRCCWFWRKKPENIQQNPESCWCLEVIMQFGQRPPYSPEKSDLETNAFAKWPEASVSVFFQVSRNTLLVCCSFVASP